MLCFVCFYPESDRKSKRFGEGLIDKETGFKQPWDLK